MGLVLEIVDSIIEIKGRGLYTKSEIDYSKGIRSEYFTLRYAIPVVFFQFVDNIIIPYFTYFWVVSLMRDFSIVSLLIVIIPVFSTLFSLWQTIYYFLFPTEKYLNFWSRFLGETSLGCFLSALFRFQFKTKFP
jgi:hypothetical protein